MTCFALESKAMFSEALIVLFCFALLWKQYLLLFTAGWISGPLPFEVIWLFFFLLAVAQAPPRVSLHQCVTYPDVHRSVQEQRRCYFHPVFVIFHFSLMNVCNITALWWNCNQEEQSEKGLFKTCGLFEMDYSLIKETTTEHIFTEHGGTWRDWCAFVLGC